MSEANYRPPHHRLSMVLAHRPCTRKGALMRRASQMLALVIAAVTACVIFPGAPTETAQINILAAPAASPAAPNAQSPFGIDGVMRWPNWGSFSPPAALILRTGSASRHDA